MAFEEQYSMAESQLRDALWDFRKTYPEKTYIYKDHTWSYYDIGDSNDRVILWLVGGLKMADAAFRSIPIMQDDFRIIVPSYPAVSTMTGLADGLNAILKAEGITKCSVLAGSYGGMIAQVFVRRHSEHVNKLILSTTTAPNSQHAENYQQQREMVSQSPDDLVMETAKSRMYGMVNPSDHEQHFWKAYLDELYSYRLTKDDLLSTYDSIIDYMTAYDFHPDDLANWRGEILILDSSNDNVFDSSAREHVNQLYPQAHSHTFANAGHSPASSQRDIYFATVRKFLQE